MPRHAGDPLLLMTPGPTRVPARVLTAGAQSMIHHRSAEFSTALTSLIRGLGLMIGRVTRHFAR